MAKPKKPKPKDEDEAQSRRFFAMAKELEEAGELDPEVGEDRFNALIKAPKSDTTPDKES